VVSAVLVTLGIMSAASEAQAATNRKLCLNASYGPLGEGSKIQFDGQVNSSGLRQVDVESFADYGKGLQVCSYQASFQGGTWVDLSFLGTNLAHKAVYLPPGSGDYWTNLSGSTPTSTDALLRTSTE
jgi:hypothetical protein